MHVSPAAFAALCRNKAFGLAHIRHNGAAGLFSDYGSARHAYFKVFAVFAVLSVSAAGKTVFCGVFALVSEVGKRCKIVVYNKYDIAALAAVAAVRPAGGNVFFTVKRDRSVAAVSCLYLDLSYINKHVFTSFY